MDFLDATTYRILDTLTRDLDRAHSINELTKKIRRLHKTAHYKNIYDKIKELEKKDYIEITRIGKTKAVGLNLRSYLLADLLAEMELKKKQWLLEKRPELQTLVEAIETTTRRTQTHVKSISLIKAEKNIKSNRIELLAIVGDMKETLHTREQMLELQKKHNIKIDTLTTDEDNVRRMLMSDEANPLREMLTDQITFYNPQAYWAMMKTMIEDGRQIRLRDEETNPARISEKDLAYNLDRFGYSEMGAAIKAGEKICPEYVITAILLGDDARRTQNIPTILIKNRIDYDTLLFLAKKYNREEKLLGLLDALNRIKPSEESRQTQETLKALGVKPEKADIRTIRQNMRLYNAI